MTAMTRIGSLLLGGSLAALVAASFFLAVVNNMVRLAVVAAVVFAVVGLALLAVQFKPLRVVVALVVVAFVIVVVAPIGADGPTLQQQMVKEIVRYDGVPYEWGGESLVGIDCSGLPRSARRSAAVTLALQKVDPGLLRFAALDWLVDVPARGFLEGRGTVRVAAADRAALLPPEALVPGNLIATADGSHVMVVLDATHLIEADPLPNKVIIAPIDDLKNPWMTTKVVAVRFLSPQPP